MDQFDLFAAEDTTPTTHDITPVSTFEPADHPVVIEAETHEGTVWAFARAEMTRLWDKPTHRERSLAQLSGSSDSPTTPPGPSLTICRSTSMPLPTIWRSRG